MTFDEFLAIPPCTTGIHSTIDDTPIEQPKQTAEVPIESNNQTTPSSNPTEPTISQAARTAIPQKTAVPAEAEPESEDDNPALTIPPNTTCRRRGCQEVNTETGSREGESCIHHPGHPIFHEGSKGWSCCKKKVLEFDEFLKIEGCKTKTKHMFVGSGKRFGETVGEKTLTTVRY